MKQKLGQTEVILDNLNPCFIKEIVVDYYFEMEQRFSVEVYDVDVQQRQQSPKPRLHWSLRVCPRLSSVCHEPVRHRASRVKSQEKCKFYGNYSRR